VLLVDVLLVVVLLVVMLLAIVLLAVVIFAFVVGVATILCVVGLEVFDLLALGRRIWAVFEACIDVNCLASSPGTCFSEMS
jgi:hypothetical protein